MMPRVIPSILIYGSVVRKIKDLSVSSLVLPKPKESWKCDHLRILLALCSNMEKLQKAAGELLDGYPHQTHTKGELVINRSILVRKTIFHLEI